jgi:hypothetical protein
MKNILLIALMVANLGEVPAFAAPADWAADNQFSLSTVYDFGSSKEEANMLATPATGEYESGQWMFKVAIPYARTAGTGGAAFGMGHIKADDTARDQPPGLAAASYNIYSGTASTFGINLTGKVKLNTVSAGLGSGQNDYAAQADAYQSIDKFTALGSLGYKVLGNPAGINMNRVVYGSFGGSYQLDDEINGGVDLSLSQNPFALRDGHTELTAYVSRRINKNFKAKGYVLKGFSNGSPDSSLGAQVYYGF